MFRSNVLLPMDAVSSIPIPRSARGLMGPRKSGWIVRARACRPKRSVMVQRWAAASSIRRSRNATPASCTLLQGRSVKPARGTLWAEDRGSPGARASDRKRAIQGSVSPTGSLAVQRDRMAELERRCTLPCPCRSRLFTVRKARVSVAPRVSVVARLFEHQVAPTAWACSSMVRADRS